MEHIANSGFILKPTNCKSAFAGDLLDVLRVSHDDMDIITKARKSLQKKPKIIEQHCEDESLVIQQ